MTDDKIYLSVPDAERVIAAVGYKALHSRASDRKKWDRLKRDIRDQIDVIKTSVCEQGQHSWRMAGFDFQGYREGGGIANLMHRKCEKCSATHDQIEVTWPDTELSGRTNIEPWPPKGTL